MTSDDFLSLRLHAKEFANTLRNITVGSSVETITAYTILLIKFIRNSIHVGMLRHSLVESCIEYTNLRNIGQNGSNCIYTFQVGRIMKRSQVIASSKSSQHFRSQPYRLAELFASMHHTVTHSVNFIQRLDGSIFRACQSVQDKFHTYGMLWDVLFKHFLLATGQSELQKRVLQTNFFDTTLSDNFFPVHIKQFVFDGRATAVQY